MNAVKKVLIVGGGIGGLCAAIALRRQGIEVDLVELKTQWTVYGVGIIQQSNVFREMAKSGVLDGYLDAACAFEDVTINTTAGERLARIPGQRLAGPEYPANVGISRLALHQVLSETVAALGVSVRLGLSVESLEQVGEGVDVLFTDTRRGRYDLVVGADGLPHARLAVRRAVLAAFHRPGGVALQLSTRRRNRSSGHLPGSRRHGH